MKNKIRFLITTAVIAAFYRAPAYAAGRAGQVNAGLNYPGISARYFINSSFAAEVKFQSGAATVLEQEATTISPAIPLEY